MRFDATVESFAAALADPSMGPPPQTRGCEGRPDARRFAVYRNNVAVGLIGSLEMRYPVTRRLVGDEFFRGLARAFVAHDAPALAPALELGHPASLATSSYELSGTYSTAPVSPS